METVKTKVALTKDDVGSHCVYINPVGKRIPALITAVWGPQCINVVCVVEDEKQTDNYGRKIERYTSVMHRMYQQAHGNYFQMPYEVEA